MDELDFDPDAFVFSGELWIAVPEGQEQEALEGRAPFLGGNLEDGRKFIAVFTDDDLAERFIDRVGAKGRAVPTRFVSRSKFVTFLMTIQEAGYTHLLLDPAGQAWGDRIAAISEFLEAAGG